AAAIGVATAPGTVRPRHRAGRTPITAFRLRVIDTFPVRVATDPADPAARAARPRSPRRGCGRFLPFHERSTPLIAITRPPARGLRAVFRRHARGAARRGPVPPLILVADPTAGLLARFRSEALAVEHALPERGTSEGTVHLPLDALA